MAFPFAHVGGWFGGGNQERIEPLAASPMQDRLHFPMGVGEDLDAYYSTLPQNPDAVRARQLQELDMMGDLPASTFNPYVERLQKQDALLMKHLANKPGSYEVRKRLLEESPNLAMYETNFNANPYDYFDPGTEIESLAPRKRLHPKDLDFIPPQYEAVVQGGNQWHNKVLIDPNIRYSMTDALLGHESGAHVPQVTRGVRSNWQPNFSLDFVRGLGAMTKDKKSPFYQKGSASGYGFHTDPYEIMGYLMGREAELPKGKTLKDDPAIKYLFDRDPGMYEEYVRSRNILRQHYTKPKK